MNTNKIFAWVVLISFGIQMVAPYSSLASTDGYLTSAELRIAQANGYVPTSSSIGDGSINFTNLSSGNNQVSVTISSEELLRLVQDTPPATPPVSVVPDPVSVPADSIGPDVFDTAYYKEETQEPVVEAVVPSPATVAPKTDYELSYSYTQLADGISLGTSGNALDSKQMLEVHGTIIPITSGVDVAVIAQDQVMLSDKENAQHQTILTFDETGKTTSIQNRHDGLYDLDDVISGRAKPIDTVVDAAGFLFSTLTGDTNKAQAVIQDYYSPDEMAYGNWIYPESTPGELAGMVQVKDASGAYVTVNDESIMQSEGEGLLNPHKYADYVGLAVPAVADWVFGKEEAVTYTDASGDLQTGWVNERTLRNTDKSIVAMPDEVSKVTQKVSCSLDADGNVIYWQDNAQVADPSARELAEHWSILQDGSTEKTILGEYILAKASGETVFTTAFSVPLGLIPLPGMAAIGANGYLGNNESYAEIAAYLKDHPEVYQTQEYKNLDHQNIAAGYINGMPAPFEINTLRAIPSAFVDTSNWNKKITTQPADSDNPKKIYYSADEVGAILPATNDKWSAYVPTEQRYTSMDAVTDVALAVSLVSPLIGDEEGMIAAKLGNTGVKITNAVGFISAIPIDDVVALSSKAARINSAASKALQGAAKAEMFVDGATAVSDATKIQRFVQGAAKTGAVWSGVSAASDVGYSFLSGNGLPSIDEVVQSARTGFGQGFVFGGAVQGIGAVAKAAGLGDYAQAIKANPAESSWYQRWGATAADTAIKYADNPGLVADHSLAGAESFIAVGPIFHAVSAGLESLGESFFYDENGNWGLHWDPHVTEMKGPKGETNLPWYQDLALSAVSAPKDTGLWLGTVTEVAGITSSVLDPSGEGLVSRWAANTARDGYLRGTLKTALNADAELTGSETAGKNWLLNTPTTAEQVLTQIDNAAFFSGLTSATDAALTSDFSKQQLGINAQDAAVLSWAPFLLVPRYDGGANPGLATGDKTAPSDRIVTSMEKLQENSGSSIVPPETKSSSQSAAEQTKGQAASRPETADPGIVNPQGLQEKAFAAEQTYQNALLKEADYAAYQILRDRAIKQYVDLVRNIETAKDAEHKYDAVVRWKTYTAYNVYLDYIGKMYDAVRTASYEPAPSENPEIGEVTLTQRFVDGKQTITAFRTEDGDWNYRHSADRDYKPSAVKWRMSFNVRAEDGLIEGLDSFASQHPDLVVAYKSPTFAQDWNKRFDPVTIYMSDRPTAEQIKQIVEITQPYIRDTRDTLIGEKIAPGVSLDQETSGNYDKFKALAERGSAIDPALGKAIEYMYTKMGTSAGIYYAIEEVINRVSEEKARLTPGELTQGKISANTDAAIVPDVDNAKSQDTTPLVTVPAEAVEALKERVSKDAPDASVRDVRRNFINDYINRLKEICAEYPENAYRPENLLDKPMSTIYLDWMRYAYDTLRLSGTDYEFIQGDTRNIDKITGSDLVVDGKTVIRVLNQNGWHYRIPVYNQEIPSVNCRISINANANEGIVKALDAFFLKNNIEGYYKTPAFSLYWYGRHDPITVYLNDKLTDAQTNELVDITKPYIRSEADVLLGEKIAPGVAFDKEPNRAMVEKLEQEARLVDPALGDAVREFLYEGDRVRVSAGNYWAAEQAVQIAKEYKSR